MTATITSLCSKIGNQTLFETSNTFDNFKKIATPIVSKIMPYVELYRSRHLIVRPVISITGCSGVGKSWFSKQLCAHFAEIGVNAKILKFDDFLDPEPFDGALDHIHPHFDHHKCHAFLQKVIDGEELIEKPAWSKAGPFKIKQDYLLKDVELLIFEGEYTLCDSETYDFLKFANLRLIIDADDADIIRWDWERERYFKPNSFLEFTQSKIDSLTRYRKILEPLKSHADFVIKKDKNHSLILD